MALFIEEMARVLRGDGKLVIVLGKTSNVLGCAFKNSQLVEDLIELSGAFSPVEKAERVFTNRFGERIYEDILISNRQTLTSFNMNDVRELSRIALEEALENVPDANKISLFDAIERRDTVMPSPELSISVPTHFKS